MKRKWLLLLLGMAILFPIGCFLWTIHQSRTVFTVHSIEKDLSWSDGPAVKLDSSRIKKLDGEIARLIDEEAPGTHLKYSVVSLDNKRVEVMYVGEVPVSDSLQKTLDAFIQKRCGELAREQTLTLQQPE